MYIDKATGREYKIIGMCVCGVQEEIVHDIIKSICRHAEQCGMKVLLFSTFEDMFIDSLFTRAASSVFKLINTGLIDAVVVLPESIKSNRVSDAIIRDARRMNIPVVSVDRDEPGCSSIVFDYVNTFERIVRHVIEHHKCRRINFIAGFKGNEFSEARIDVYKKVLAQNNIPFEEDRLGYGDFWSLPTEKVVEEFIRSDKPFPEAIICCNDTMAITCCQVLRKHGISVPDDVIVTGFDGIQLQHYYVPNITTASPDIELLGETVLGMISFALGGYTEPVKKVIPYKLDLTDSCGCGDKTGKVAGDKIIELYDMTTVYDQHEKHMFGYISKSVDCKDIDDITELMINHADYHHTWCCINSDFLSSAKDPVRSFEHFTGEMMLLCEMKGERLSQKPSKFPIKTLLPDLGSALEKYNSIVITPLHFIGEVIGYLAFDFDDDSLNLKNIHRYISNTNQILENYKSRINLEHANAVLEEMHIRDALTGIYNRRGFYKYATQLLKKCRSNKQSVVIFSIDMDGLKFINDTFGHIEGDKAIQAISDTLVRVSGENAICARFGGDEFSILMPLEEGMTGDYITGLFCQEIDKVNLGGRFPYKIAISSGYELMSEDAISIDEALRRADIKMYKSKRLKKTTPQIDDSRSTTQDNYRSRLTQLLLNDGSEVYFYINYISNNWTTASNSYLMPELNSDVYDPINALLESGAMHEEDISNYRIMIGRVREGIDSGTDDDKISINFRIKSELGYEWYRMSLLFRKNERRVTEAVGHVHRLTEREVMEKKILSSYKGDIGYQIFSDAVHSRFEKDDGDFAFIQFDIAKFKAVNEVYGVEAGDEIIEHINDVLAGLCDDSKPYVRLGSDIFVLVMSYSDMEDIISFIRKLENGMIGYKNIKYSFTFGVYLVNDKALPARYMSDCANIARNSVKGNALLNIGFYNEELRASITHKKMIEDSMRQALAGDEFKMYLQPKISISTGRIIGAEALVRWEQTDSSLMQPNDFIPIFEQNGFIVKIDEYMWLKACEYISARLKNDKLAVPISVNVSRIHLSDNDYLTLLDSLLSEYGIDKKYIELEITETVENVNTNEAIVAARDDGYKLLMDDFGSGYSSLGSLKSTPFDVLKIDTKFLSSSMSSERGKKIIEHIISMALDIGLDVIAEGVETIEQAEFLSSCGCDMAQGFYYSGAVTPERFAQLLDEQEKGTVLYG
ncbi:MAG: EAL domain-containing protein [Ruminococcus sp.]|nr:EAL domain-containing protein [Ruminococcus sp.]